MLPRRKAVRTKNQVKPARVRASARVRAVVPAPTRGTIVGWQRNRGILLVLPGQKTPVAAQSLVVLTESELDLAAAERREALVVFEDGERSRPVILGLIAPVPSKSADSLTRAAAPGGARQTTVADDLVVLRGRDAIEIRCGAASITLQRDGHILVRGKNLVSRASEKNRVMGGSLHFN